MGLIITRADPEVCGVFQFPPIETPVEDVEEVTVVVPVVTATTVAVLFENVSTVVVDVFAESAAACADVAAV